MDEDESLATISIILGIIAFVVCFMALLFKLRNNGDEFIEID
jgi:hypothetical protein